MSQILAPSIRPHDVSDLAQYKVLPPYRPNTIIGQSVRRNIGLRGTELTISVCTPYITFMVIGGGPIRCLVT